MTQGKELSPNVAKLTVRPRDGQKVDLSSGRDQVGLEVGVQQGVQLGLGDVIGLGSNDCRAGHVLLIDTHAGSQE